MFKWEDVYIIKRSNLKQAECELYPGFQYNCTIVDFKPHELKYSFYHAVEDLQEIRHLTISLSGLYNSSPQKSV